MFDRFPLLFYGLGISLSAAFGVTENYVLIPVLLILMAMDKKRGLTLLPLIIAGFIAGHYVKPTIPPESGTYNFQLEQIVKRSNSYLLKGTILPYHAKAYIRAKELPDDLTDQLLVTGRLKNTLLFANGIEAVEGGRYAHTRFNLKQKVKAWIESITPHSRSADLLSALITGDMDNKWLKKDFARFGLQHILAISGFHFSFLAMSLAWILNGFFPHRWIPWALILMLASYFLFLGPTSSIIRAWIAIAMVSFAQIFRRENSALNNLGLALFAIVLWDPLALTEAGFILSFTLTAAILLFAKPFDDKLKTWLYPRTFSTLKELSIRQQLGVMALSFIRQSLSLNGAVLLLALPLTLVYFGAFPLWSLFYNLFFPALIGIALFLFLFSFIPYFALINSYYIDFVLNLLHEMPSEMDGVITWSLNPNIIIVYTALIFGIGIYKRKSQPAFNF